MDGYRRERHDYRALTSLGVLKPLSAATWRRSHCSVLLHAFASVIYGARRCRRGRRGFDPFAAAWRRGDFLRSLVREDFWRGWNSSTFDDDEMGSPRIAGGARLFEPACRMEERVEACSADSCIRSERRAAAVSVALVPRFP